MENMSKPLVEFTFSFSWRILISNLLFDLLICINENVSLHKKYSRNKLCHCWKSPIWFCSNLQCTNCCFASADVTAPFIKCDEIQWSNYITVNTHCDVTMGRWRCLGNHISQQWVDDVAAAQGGTSVQLYCKALIIHVLWLTILFENIMKRLSKLISMFNNGNTLFMFVNSTPKYYIFIYES